MVVGVPGGIEDTGDVKYKYFDLSTGSLLSVSVNKDPNTYPRICFDYLNNVLWAVNDNKKSFENMACYINSTIPNKF